MEQARGGAKKTKEHKSGKSKRWESGDNRGGEIRAEKDAVGSQGQLQGQLSEW